MIADANDNPLLYKITVRAATLALAELQPEHEPVPQETLERAHTYLAGILGYVQGQSVGHSLLNALAPHLEQRGFGEDWILFLTKLMRDGTTEALRVDSAFHLGTVYIRMSRYGKAEEQFENVLRWAQPGTLRASQATIRLAMCRRTVSPALLIAQLKATLPAVQDNFMERGYLYNNISILHQRGTEADFVTAEQYMQLALQDWRASRNQRLLGWGLSNMAFLLLAKKDYSNALPYGDEAIAIFRVLGDRLHLSYTLNHVGICHYKRGTDKHKALRAYDESIALSTDLYNFYHLAMVKSNKARLLQSLKHYAQARTLFEQVITYYRHNLPDDVRYYVNDLDSLSEILRTEGEVGQALALLSEAAEMLKHPTATPALETMISESLTVTRLQAEHAQLRRQK